MFGTTVLLVGALFGISCGGAQPADDRYISNQSSVERLNDGVVALVIPTHAVMQELDLDHNTVHTVNTIGRMHRAYCTGFFVSRTEILTAAHCVQRRRVVQTPFGTMEMALDESPLGDVKKITTYSMWVGARRKFLVYKTYEVALYNRTQDLALLRLAEGQTRPVHFSVFQIGADPRSGERVYVIGHPAGQPWSLTSGIISSPFRIRDSGQRYTQASAQVFFGNSGGPLINNRGEVIGVTSALITPHMAFFSHVRSIRSFLNGR